MILLFFIFIYLLIFIYIVMKQIRKRVTLFNEGKYEEVIANTLSKLNSNSKYKFKQYNLITIANCYSRIGNFMESMDYLEKADETRMSKSIKASYFSLISFNLYYLNQNIDKAYELIKRSRVLLDIPTSILLNALIDQVLKDSENAEQLVKQYLNQTSRNKYIVRSSTLIYVDDFVSNVSEKFMLGLYYMKIGEIEKSKNYFFIAANFKYQNYFSDRAKEFLDSIELTGIPETNS